jgi:uncharacterized protein (TIGR02118 family)
MSFKLIILAKRKPGMSPQAFREYYETHHSVLARSLAPAMRRYQRNYLTPFPAASTPAGEVAFDCVTEVWFDREEIFQQTLAQLAAQPDKAAALAADEENLFDRSSIRWYAAVESDSV